MSTSALLVERPTPDVVVITLHRPEQMNALTESMVEEFLGALHALEDDAARCVVVTGAGRGFCAGLDLVANAEILNVEGSAAVRAGMRIARSFGRIVPAMRRFPKPIIAAVNGPAVGAGFVIALGADLRVAAAPAYFADGFVGVGLSGCELGLGYLLPRLIGASRAVELTMTGRRLPAVEAEAIGLVHRLAAEGEAVAGALELAAQVAANTPFGMWMTKDALWASIEGTSLETMIALEGRSQVLALLTDDAREKRNATAERRPPEFTGD